MENSKAYLNFMDIMLNGSRGRFDGFQDNLLEEIYDFEREEVEEMIFEKFKKGDSRLINLVSSLRYYDGIALLKKQFGVEDDDIFGFYIALELYKATNEIVYFEMVKEVINRNESEYEFLISLFPVSDRLDVYTFVKGIYLKSKNKYTIKECIRLLLMYNNYISKESTVAEMDRTIELSNYFSFGTTKDRQKSLEKLEDGTLFK